MDHAQMYVNLCRKLNTRVTFKKLDKGGHGFGLNYGWTVDCQKFLENLELRNSIDPATKIMSVKSVKQRNGGFIGAFLNFFGIKI